MNADTSTVLLMSSRHTDDNQLIWRAAVNRGWSVERVRGLRVPQVDADRVLIYMESLFAPAIAEQFGLSLLVLTEDWLQQLPDEFRRRAVALTTLGQIQQSELPLFLKPPNEKSFPATVYETTEQLLRDYDPSTRVLAATPVTWESEFRCFCLDARVRAISLYLRNGELSAEATADELDSARAFAERVLSDDRVALPRAVVLDVGIISEEGWAVVEANAAWGSGIYACDADEVLTVLEFATVKP